MPMPKPTGRGPAGARLRASEQFVRSFRWAARGRGAASELLEVLALAAAELNLPPPWEEICLEDAVYFWNGSTGESSWQHPHMEVFLWTLDALVDLIQSCHKVPQVAKAIKLHLKLADERATTKLQGWSSFEEGRRFFHNALTGESSWEDPAVYTQHELHAQYWLLARFAQHFYGDMAQGEGGSFLTALAKLEPPEEVRDYAAWIEASLASSSPIAAVPTPQRRTRPPLPPLTALPLNDGPVTPEAISPDLAFLVRAPKEEPQGLRRAQSSLERRKRSRPPLTKYPLRRSLLIWKPVDESGAEALRHSHTFPL